MKKLFIIALAALSATAFAVTPGKKDKKQKKAPVAVQTVPVKLSTPTDSLSYAAGMYTTRGLFDYVSKNFGIDSTNIQTFIDGINEGIEHKNDKQFVARAAGLQIAQMLESRIYPNMVSDVNTAKLSIDSLTFNKGFINAILGDTAVMKENTAVKYFETTMKTAARKVEEAYKAENDEWLKENAKKQGVVTLPSGLQYKVITEGKGTVATKADQVTVRYEGRLIDGTVFDSSYKRNPNTTTFRPDQVIKGWTEALCMMPEGSKWELYIPQNIAYGARRAGQIKPFSTLIFTVEVVKVEKALNTDTKAAAKEKAKSDIFTRSSAPAAAKKMPARKAKK